MSDAPKFLDQFHYQITGDDSFPKLVFLHGAMGFSLNWRRIAKAFENEYQVLVFDQRGHGRSFQPATGYAPEDYSDDLRKILDELGWEQIRLVGHSMGGRTAFHFAYEFPQRVTQLVIEDVGPGIYPTGASLVLRMLDAVPVPFVTKREAKRWFDEEFPKIFKDERNVAGLSGYLYANLTENEAKQAVWKFYAPGVRESIAQGRASDRWDVIESLSIPTLVIRGAESRDLARAVFERMIKENSWIRGVEIPNAGHWVHSDQPDLFIETLRDFFSGKR